MLRGKYACRQEWVASPPVLNIDKADQEQDTEDERHNNLWRAPAASDMRALSDGVDQKEDARYATSATPPVHGSLTSMHIARYAKERHETCGAQRYADDPEEPPPMDDLAAEACNKNSSEEPERRTAAIQTEYEVLPRSRAIDAAQEGQAGRKVRGRAQALESPRGKKHSQVLAEPSYQGPDGQPGDARQEHNACAVHIAQPAKGQQEGAGHEGEYASRPCLALGWDVQFPHEAWEEDVHPAD